MHINKQPPGCPAAMLHEHIWAWMNKRISKKFPLGWCECAPAGRQTDRLVGRWAGRLFIWRETGVSRLLNAFLLHPCSLLPTREALNCSASTWMATSVSAGDMTEHCRVAVRQPQAPQTGIDLSVCMSVSARNCVCTFSYHYMYT